MSLLSKIALSALAAALLLLGSADAQAAEWYIAPSGTLAGKGTRESPWDIATALGGGREVKPGDTMYLLAGTYKQRPKELFEVRLPGTKEKPIHVRPAPGERAIIDGGLTLLDPSAHVWIWDLEVLVSEPLPEKPVAAGSSPADLKRPWGGLHTQNDPERGPRNCKFIHLVVHNCLQGASIWRSARDCEVYGCIFYDNSWQGVDRGHGHGIYTQNDEGVKTIADCIFTGGYDGTYSIHAYGSKNAFVNNFHIEGNVCYQTGPLLIGGGRPSRGIKAIDNYLYNAPLRIGYTAPHNEDCEVRGNVVVNGDLTITRYKKVVNENNLVLHEKAKRPAGAKVVLRASKYDPRRAHLAIFNWEKKPAVEVDASGFLKPGERFRLQNPRDFFGKPVLSGTYDGGPLRVPLKDEFAAFVVLKEERQ
jgi:hypothetical protein